VCSSSGVDLLPRDLLQSTLEIALTQPLSDLHLMNNEWLRRIANAARVCSAWRDAVRQFITLLDATANNCHKVGTPDLTLWTMRGWQSKHYWLWRLAMHQRCLAHEAGSHEVL